MSFPWANEYKPSHPLMQWLDEKLPLPRFVYNAIGAGYPVPRNLNYWWNFGSIAGICLVIQILTGLFLAMACVTVVIKRPQLAGAGAH